MDGSQTIRDFFNKVVNFVVEDGLIALTAVLGVVVGLLDLFLDLEQTPLKEPIPVVLLIIGLVAASLWIERRKSSRQIDTHAHNIMSKLQVIQNNSGVLDRLLRLPVEKRGLVEEWADLHIKADHHIRQMDVSAKSIIDILLEEQREQMKSLSVGELRVSMREAPYFNSLLMEHSKHRMDAVSDNDLDFWDGEPTGSDYFSKSLTARDRGGNKLTVTRIFIVRLEDLLEKNIDRLVKILEKHHANNIGYAVAIDENLIELRNDVGKREVAQRVRFDFALFDTERAVSYFRKENPRRFIAVLATENPTHPNNVLIQTQRLLHRDLICECWVASERFHETVRNSVNGWECVQKKTQEHNQNYKEFGIQVDHEIFPLLVREQSELKSKLLTAREWNARILPSWHRT